jgi:hypothetical protein
MCRAAADEHWSKEARRRAEPESSAQKQHETSPGTDEAGVSAQSRCRCGRGGRSPGADVAGADAVPVQVWHGADLGCRRRSSVRPSLVDGRRGRARGSPSAHTASQRRPPAMPRRRRAPRRAPIGAPQSRTSLPGSARVGGRHWVGLGTLWGRASQCSGCDEMDETRKQTPADADRRKSIHEARRGSRGRG